jgi:hypothetical protein
MAKNRVTAGTSSQTVDTVEAEIELAELPKLAVEEPRPGPRFGMQYSCL